MRFRHFFVLKQDRKMLIVDVTLSLSSEPLALVNSVLLKSASLEPASVSIELTVHALGIVCCENGGRLIISNSGAVEFCLL